MGVPGVEDDDPEENHHIGKPVEARIKKWQQMSFGDPRASHELAIADAELRLRGAERDWAKEQMTLTEIRAAKSGVTMFLDKKDLIGKPVAVGEKIMEIADPDHVEARIDLSVADALILRAGARTKLFLDSDPLRAREARIAQADYQARVKPNNTLVLRYESDTALLVRHLPLPWEVRGMAFDRSAQWLLLVTNPPPLPNHWVRSPTGRRRSKSWCIS